MIVFHEVQHNCNDTTYTAVLHLFESTQSQPPKICNETSHTHHYNSSQAWPLARPLHLHKRNAGLACILIFPRGTAANKTASAINKCSYTHKPAPHIMCENAKLSFTKKPSVSQL